MISVQLIPGVYLFVVPSGGRGCHRRRLFLRARRSSIKSRSTSQYLNDEKRSEGVRSTSTVSSLAIVSGPDLPGSLAELRRLCLDFAFRERVGVFRPTPITFPQGLQHHNGQSSCAKSSEYFTARRRDTGAFTIKRKKSMIKLKPSLIAEHGHIAD